MSSVSSGRVAEVLILFEESVLAVRELGCGERFTVGESSAADLPWPVAPCDLLRVSPAGMVELCAPASLGVEIELLDEHSQPTTQQPRFLDELDTGTRVASLPQGRRARLRFGELTLIVGVAAAAQRLSLPPPIMLQPHATTAVVACVAFLALAAIQAIPPSGASLAIDPSAVTARLARVSFAPPVEPPSPPSSGGASAAPSSGAAPSAPLRRARVIPTTRPSAAPKTMAEAKDAAQLAAAQAGILGVVRVGEGSHLGAIFGHGSALGTEAEGVLGSLEGREVGDAAGSLAIDRLGPGGRGGGGEGTVGVGPLGVVGRGPWGKGGSVGCAGTSCMSPALIGHKSTAPDVVVGQAEVRGTLDKEIIRRAVRQQSAAFKFCYEKELQQHPDLSGRVVTRFTISPSGQVVAAATASSTLGSAKVDACVADVFRRLALPAMPHGSGVALVTYPLNFTAAGQRE